jgi:hypothetical protein
MIVPRTGGSRRRRRRRKLLLMSFVTFSRRMFNIDFFAIDEMWPTFDNMIGNLRCSKLYKTETT